MSGSLPVAGYARLSLAKDTSVSIASQREMLEGWASTHGREIRIYTDDGFSGSKDIERPGFESMLADIRAGVVEPTIVARSLDRLGRRTKQLIDLAEDHRIVTVSDGLDTSSPIGRLLLTLMAGVASYESEVIGARQAMSQDYRRRNGRSVGSLPYGYINEQRSDGAYRVIDEGEAQVLRDVIERALDGDSWRSIADWLNERGIRTRRGNLWQSATVVQITETPQIAGMRPDGDDVVRDEIGVPIVDKHLAVCTVQEFERLQEMRAERSKFRSHGRKHERLMLMGIATCAGCGRKLTRANATAKGRTYPQYHCPADARTLCPQQVTISARKLDDYIVEQIQPALDYPIMETVTAEDPESVERKRLITLRMEALNQSLLMANSTERLAIVEDINALERERDAIDATSDAFEEVVDTGATWEDMFASDRHAVCAELLANVIVSKAGRGNTRAPVDERVELVWKGLGPPGTSIGEAFTVDTA